MTTAAQPRERPILFSGDMVRALLAGTKTQTRRIAPISDLNIKPFSDDLVTWGVSFTKPVKGVIGSHSGGKFSELQARHIIASQFCPYGQPGDRLWVREAWARTAVYQAACQEMVVYREGDNRTDYGGPWKPGIHMFRRDSRILLEITEVRVERLQDISDADSLAEGIPKYDILTDGDPEPGWHRGTYERLWKRINGADSWATNPWVWAVSFKVVKP